MAKPYRVLGFLTIGVILAVPLIYLLLLRPTPIQVGGFTSFEGEHTLIFEAINRGVHDVELIDVRINGGEQPAKAELGVSYSLHLVGGTELDGNSDIQFMDMQAMPIQPGLTADQKRSALQDTALTPLNYGVRILSEVPIRRIELEYRYFGFTFKRELPMGRFFQ
ncbi:hypothetical protein JCM10914A_23850 [Paenibacillus sp. JCM 10914]